MSVHKINSKNIDKYSKILPKLAHENVVRSCYRGVASEGNEGIAILIWELVNEPKTGEERADVRYIVNKDMDAFDEVFNYFLNYAKTHSLTVKFEVRGTVSKVTKGYLKEKGFPLTRGEGKDVTISVGDLVNVTSKYRRDIPEYIKSIGELNLGELGRVLRKCLYCGAVGIVYDLETINISYFERRVSCCLYSEGEVLGAFMFHKNAENELEICILACFSDDPADILYMLCYSGMVADRCYPADTRIVIRRNTTAMRGLVEKLFPGAKTVTVTKDGVRK